MFKKLIGLALCLSFLMSLVLVTPSYAVPTVDPATVHARKLLIHRSLLNIYIAQKRKDDCLREYPVMIGLQPEDPKLQYEYGLFLAKFSSKAKAVPHLKKAASMDPGNADYAGALGTTYIQMKNFEPGLDALRRAISNGGEQYKKIYEDSYKYVQYQKQKEIYKKKQEAYRKKLEQRQKAAEAKASGDDDDDDW